MYKNKQYKKNSKFNVIFTFSIVFICLILVIMFTVYKLNNKANICSINRKTSMKLDIEELNKDLARETEVKLEYLKNRIFNLSNNYDLFDKFTEYLKINDEKLNDNYDYSKEVPENDKVNDSYFDDAVFIGNSQVEGIKLYKAMGNMTVYAGKGIMANTIFTKEIIRDNNKKITILDALEQKPFGKVYIMLGANELGWAFSEVFVDKYSEVIDEIKKLQPNADIYINTIIPVSKSRSKRDSIYNNVNIEKFNNLIKKIAEDKKVYFINTKNVFGTDDGCLPEEAGTDGIHFYGTYYENWFNYLKKHTI